MKNKLIWIFIVSFILCQGFGTLMANEVPVKAKDSFEISVEDAIEIVKRSHPDILMQELALEKANQELALATRAFLPDIDLDYIASSAAGGPGLIITLSRLLEPLFSLKSLMANKKIKKIISEKEEVMIEVRELEAGQQIKELFTAVLIHEKLVKSFEDSLTRGEGRLELKELAYQEGRLSKEEILKERLLLQEASAQLLKARVLFQKSEAIFRSLLDLPYPLSFTLVSPVKNEGESIPLSLEECFDLARTQNPLVKVLALNEKASLIQNKKTDSRFKVSGLFAGFGESQERFGSAARFGATGNFSLYDWGKKEIRSEIRALNHDALILSHDKEIKGLEKSILENYSALSLLRFEKGTLKGELAAKEESKRTTQLLKDSGKARRENVLEAENSFHDLETRFWQKQIEFWIITERLLKDLGIASLTSFKERVHP